VIDSSPAQINTNEETNRLFNKKMLKTNATKIALNRKSRSFRVVFAALSVFFFIFSRTAEGALDEENNMGRSLLQDHSSAHAV